jgi:hypothetical protein
MKIIVKSSFFSLFLFFSQSLFAIVSVHAPNNTTADIQLKNFTTKDYQVLIGKKLTLRDKLVFHFAKQELMKTHKTVDQETLHKAVSGIGSDFNLGGFLLGFLLSFIGVLIALLFGGDVLRWAWKGFLIGLLVGLIGWLLGK